MDSLLSQLVRGKALLLIIVLGLGGSFPLGCNITLISSPSPYIKHFINSSWTHRYGEAPGENTVTFIWSAVTSVFALGALFGSISVRSVTNKLGRKRAMIYNNTINVVALCIMIASKPANSFEMILLSRFLFGLTSGLGWSIHVLYLGDCSPKKIRGMVTLSTAIFLSSGKLAGQVMGISEILGREDCWNILLSVPAFFSIIQMVTLPFFPEAPRYLLIEKGNVEQCKKGCLEDTATIPWPGLFLIENVRDAFGRFINTPPLARNLQKMSLQCLWGPGDYKLEIEEMQVENAALQGERSKTLLELLRDQSVRWQLLTVLFISLAIQFCGISAFSVFAFSIFEEAGIPVDKICYITMGIGACEVLTNITCGMLIDRVGRKVLLWGGFGSMAIFLALITLTLEIKDYAVWIPYSTIGLIFLYMIFYGGGPAGVGQSLFHEIFIQSYRSAAFIFIGILMWGGFAVLGFIFPFLLIALKSFSFLFFSSVCLAISVYVYFILPETKGKTPLEISEDFRNIRLRRSSPDNKCLETRL